MTKRWRAAMLLAALVGGWQLVAAALPQADGPLDERVAAIVKSEILAQGVPSVSVAVMRDGRMLLERAWGIADVEKNVSASASTTYYIGSVTKQTRHPVIDYDGFTHTIPRDADSALEKPTGFGDRFDLGVAERVVGEAGGANVLPSNDRPVLCVHRNRPEVHSLNQREHRCRAGNAQRECQDSGAGQGLGPPQAAARETQVLVQTLEGRALSSARDVPTRRLKHVRPFP